MRGDDLIAFGLKPGPKFGEILEAVETQQLEGGLHTREEALAWVKERILVRIIFLLIFFLSMRVD